MIHRRGGADTAQAPVLHCGHCMLMWAEHSVAPPPSLYSLSGIWALCFLKNGFSSNRDLFCNPYSFSNKNLFRKYIPMHLLEAEEQTGFVISTATIYTGQKSY